MKTNIKRVPATPEQIRAAREYYQTDDIEIDENAAQSRADEEAGQWVSAWVWVSDEMIDDLKKRG
jgi:hypothetical protein